MAKGEGGMVGTLLAVALGIIAGQTIGRLVGLNTLIKV